MIEVSELYIHPLKSAAPISVGKAAVDNFGLRDDRRWMLVDEKGNFLSQRQLPLMCLIKAEVTDGVLLVSIPEKSVVEVLAEQGCNSRVTVWGDVCNSYDCGDEVADYLSCFLKTKCRLVYFPEEEERQVDLAFAKKGDLTGFSDGFPILIVSQASLDDLNNRLKHPVAVTRFRPNIVVKGVDAFSEDGWSNINIGGIHMRVVKPCSRCSIPSVDPLTGVRSVEPVKTLRQYRMRDSKVYFGQNVIADSTGDLEIGMPVEIID